jgi:hypothetical protein
MTGQESTSISDGQKLYKEARKVTIWKTKRKNNLREIDYEDMKLIKRSHVIHWLAGWLAGMGEMRNVYNILVRKLERKRPLGRSTRRWDDNHRIDLREIEWGDVNWIHLDQDRDQWRALVNTVMNLPVP